MQHFSLVSRKQLLSESFWIKYGTEFSETPNQAYFYANFWFCTRTFHAGDSNLRQFISANASQTPLKHLKTTAGVQIWLPPQKIRRSPLIRCPRVCHKMSSRSLAVGVISFSSRPIRTSHSDCVFIDRTIITPMQI